MSIKEQLYKACVAHVDERLSSIQTALKSALAAGNEETKSSAGDKHETGRAMMQLEQEKLATQMEEALKLKAVLNRIEVTGGLSPAQLGSLVETGAANYYLAISAGQIEIADKTYFAVSPASPIGKELQGKKKGDTFSFNNQTIEILSVC